MALSALIGAWLAGSLGGAHCFAMCGGFLAAMSGIVRPADGPIRSAPLLPAKALLLRQLPFNLGRISTYAALGAVFGAAGAMTLVAADSLALQRALFVVANVFLLLLAVAILGDRRVFRPIERVGAAAFARVAPLVRPLTARDGWGARYVVGLLWGLAPCALIYSVLPVALFAGGAIPGALIMAAFGLGTLPNLMAAGWAFARAPAWLGARAVRYGAAALLAGFAVYGMWRALGPASGLAKGAFCLAL